MNYMKQNAFPLSNDVISIIFIVIIGIVVLLVYLFVKPTKRMSKKDSENSLLNQYQIASLLDRFNMYIDDYNMSLSNYSFFCNTVQKQIVAVNDMISFQEYKNYVKIFKESSSSTSKEIHRVREFFQNGNINTEIYVFLDKIAEGIEEMNNCVESIKRITPQVRVFDDFYNESERKEEKDSYSSQFLASKNEARLKFFYGCKTQEEADKRYKNLSKAFHPDAEWGDKEMFTKMNEEYKSLKF